MLEFKVPQSFLEFFAVDKVTKNGIRLGAWPEDVYAGCHDLMGHKVKVAIRA